VPPSPFLGIAGTAVTEPVKGVRVVAVAPDSPASKASLKPHDDVIVAVGGRPVDSPEALANVIGEHAIGETVQLLVFGAATFRTAAVVLKANPATTPAAAPPPQAVPSATPSAGPPAPPPPSAPQQPSGSQPATAPLPSAIPPPYKTSG
jgi:predicted metalloprotease with PDZ domain